MTRKAGRRSLLLCAAALLAVSFASCGPRGRLVASIPWKDGSGAGLAFRDSDSRPSGQEGAFSPARASDGYVLETPHAIGADDALELDLVRREGRSVPRLSVVLDGKRNGRDFKLRSGIELRDANTRFVLPLERGEVLDSVRLRLEAESPPAPAAGTRTAAGSTAQAATRAEVSCTLASIAFRPMFRGFERLADGVRVSAGFSYYIEGGRQHLAIDTPFAGIFPGGKPGCAGIVLDYGRCPDATAFDISPAAKGSGSLHLRPRLTGLRTVLGASLFPEAAQRVEFSIPAGVEVGALYASYVEDPEAELADLGRVLLSPPRDPGADFDLYRWDRFPSVLVFDFRDYAAQDRYLKRMAYFIEKIGYRGSLLTDEQMAGLHGWNAHDYRSEDLASFFEAAAGKRFALDREELALRDILLGHGVIVERGGVFLPGRGALISISRESPSYLRTQFIVHESTHAIFFLDPDYRKFVRSLWASVGADERWFWYAYFKWAGYDIGSDYLMGNEFQAYLLQQPVSRVEEYFSRTQAAELLRTHPEYKDRIDEYMKRFSSRYAEHAAALDAWIEKKYGLGAGRTYSLY
ncbi:MAG TPA: hypothetical protein VMV90_05890 [Rectinemataceae bacterium]|nr:hypothetical protein [Rectinemataceae bacterium]